VTNKSPQKSQYPSIKSFLVQNKESEDQSLHNKLLDVNMRLFDSNREYYSIIVLVIGYMKKLFATNFSDYSQLKGISGANIGIPINIIGFVDQLGKVRIMINPSIKTHSKRKQMVSSNCGSLVLRKAVKVERSCRVLVEYYDEDGKKNNNFFEDRDAFVIQHEIDHNNGILIIDREKRE